MHLGRTTLSKFLIQQLTDIPERQRPWRAAGRCGRRGQGDRGHDRQGGARGLPGRARHQERAGREPAEARRARPRGDDPQLRMGRAARRHGLRGARGALRDAGRIRARPLPAWCSIRSTAHPTPTSTCRSARSSRCCATSDPSAPCAERLPAAGPAAGGRRLRDLRAGDHDRDQRRQGHPRLHARPRDRQLHPDTSGPADSGRHQRVRHQHQQRALLGAAGASLRDRVPGRQERRCAAATSTCAGSPPWSPRCTAFSCAAASSCIRRTPRTAPSPAAAAPAVRGQPDQLSGRAGRRPGHHRQPAPAGGHARVAASARAADLRLAQRGGTHRALPRRVGERHRPALQLAAVQRALAVPPRSA